MNKILPCLSDETIAQFTQGLLTGNQLAAVQSHLNTCSSCHELVSVCQWVQQRQETSQVIDLPAELVQRVKDLVRENKGNIFELIIRFSENIFESVQTTGQVLWGPGIQSGYALRGEKAEPAHILVVEKKFDTFRVEVTVSREEKGLHNLFVRFHFDSPSLPHQPIRVSLWQNHNELESHPISPGEVCFQRIKIGCYRLEIGVPQKTLAAIDLQLIKV